MRWMMSKYASRNGFTQRQKIALDLKVGYTLMTIFFSIPLCASYFTYFQSGVYLFVGMFFPFCGMCSYAACQNDSFKCDLPGILEIILRFGVIWSPQTAFAVFYYYSTDGLMSESDRGTELFLRIFNGLLLTAVIAMYWIISKCGFVSLSEIEAEYRRRKEEGKRESESDSSDEEESEPNYDDLKCRVCLRGYSSNSEKRMPRMMECGHTVCYGCAKKLQESSAIRCPFCNEYTFDDSKDLPKNYAIIGLLEQMKLSERKEVSTQTIDCF
uniref:RING-type domain-containing protein n=1 Tax=Caenorhabditis tropicalis TaxID=1561998 RepID=A0A1I7T2N4_9PELO